MSETKKFRLTENHDVSKRFNQLVETAEKLGLSISFSGQGMQVTDFQTKSCPTYRVEDMDVNNWFSDFPPITEWQLTFEKEVETEKAPVK